MVDLTDQKNFKKFEYIQSYKKNSSFKATMTKLASLKAHFISSGYLKLRVRFKDCDDDDFDL